MMSRRETFSWFLAVVAGGTIPLLPPVALADTKRVPLTTSVATWPDLTLKPISASGYGTDPDTQNPTVPWPLILGSNELEILAILGNLVLPGEGAIGGAGDLGIAGFLNEWVSAPYPAQQVDRTLFIPLLQWFDDQSVLEQGCTFQKASRQTQINIIDELMASPVTPIMDKPFAAFKRLKVVMIFGYYSTSAVLEEIGISQNTPIMGPYPGPTDEALSHLHVLLSSLGLDADF